MPRTLALAATAFVALAGITANSPDALAQTPAIQQCIMGKIAAHVRDRDLKGLDSTVSVAQSAEFRAQCGAPSEKTAASVPARAPSTNDDIHRAALAGRNLFAQPRVRALYLAMMPMGNSGRSAPVPQGSHRSSSDGEYAMTYLCEPTPRESRVALPACVNHWAVMIHLPSGVAAACQRSYMPGQGSPAVYWYRKGHPFEEDGEGRWCPQNTGQLSPAWRAADGVRRDAQGLSQPGMPQIQPLRPDGSFRFSGHCNGFTLGGRDYHAPGPCPGGIELAVPSGVSNRPQKSRLTLRVPNPRAPVMVLDLTAANQKYGDNDIVEFVFTPASALPFSWSAMDGMRCTFVKNPADGMLRQSARVQPNATLNCGFDESRMENIDKMRFAFFASSADIAQFRAAFIAAHDKLNPGRPFVSPKPDLQTPVVN